MSPASSPAAVLAQLTKTLASGKLPAVAIRAGEQLVERLNSPVRTVILGLSGSGKSQLLNFLVGQRIVPDGTVLPSLELTWAAQSRTTVTLADETTQTHPGTALEKLVGADADFVKVQTDLPFLKHIILLEVVADRSTDSQADTIDWALRRADIVLWCSQSFGQPERELWSVAPDEIKDHSFLVLTKADTLPPDDLRQRISDLQDVVAEEFHSLFPVATLQAIAASQHDDSVDQAALAASGGTALIAAILRHTELGRRADIDSAMLFLSRFGALPPADDQNTPANKPDAAAISADAEPVSPPKKPNLMAARDHFSTALVFLQGRAVDLTGIQPTDAADSCSEILEHCTETANQLVDIFTNDGGDTTGTPEFQDDLTEAADMLLLMQLEDGHGPAADAVTLLLQLRRDLEMNLAA